jgi:hypothetical protein
MSSDVVAAALYAVCDLAGEGLLLSGLMGVGGLSAGHGVVVASGQLVDQVWGHGLLSGLAGLSAGGVGVVQRVGGGLGPHLPRRVLGGDAVQVAQQVRVMPTSA